MALQQRTYVHIFPEKNLCILCLITIVKYSIQSVNAHSQCTYIAAQIYCFVLRTDYKYMKTTWKYDINSTEGMFQAQGVIH